MELHRVIDSIQNFGRVFLSEVERVNQNKMIVEKAVLQHKTDIAKCFTIESFKMCQKYLGSRSCDKLR